MHADPIWAVSNFREVICKKLKLASFEMWVFFQVALFNRSLIMKKCETLCCRSSCMPLKTALDLISLSLYFLLCPSTKTELTKSSLKWHMDQMIPLCYHVKNSFSLFLHGLSCKAFIHLIHYFLMKPLMVFLSSRDQTKYKYCFSR